MAIIPYQYLYLLLGLIELAAALWIFMKRPDLRLPMFLAGMCGGVLEVVSETWYLRDYWQPLTIIPNWPAPEDFIYGFGLTALSIGVWPFLCNDTYIDITTEADRRTPWSRASKLVTVVWTGCIFVAAMYLMPALLDTPSIWAATLAFGSIGFGVLVYDWRRRIGPALYTAVIMGLLALGGYAFGLNVLIDGDDFLRMVLLQYGTDLDARILGNVPIDELAWNITRGWCALLMYLELAGKQLAPRRIQK